MSWDKQETIFIGNTIIIHLLLSKPPKPLTTKNNETKPHTHTRSTSFQSLVGFRCLFSASKPWQIVEIFIPSCSRLKRWGYTHFSGIPFTLLLSDWCYRKPSSLIFKYIFCPAEDAFDTLVRPHICFHKMERKCRGLKLLSTFYSRIFSNPSEGSTNIATTSSSTSIHPMGGRVNVEQRFYVAPSAANDLRLLRFISLP